MFLLWCASSFISLPGCYGTTYLRWTKVLLRTLVFYRQSSDPNINTGKAINASEPLCTPLERMLHYNKEVGTFIATSNPTNKKNQVSTINLKARVKLPVLILCLLPWPMPLQQPFIFYSQPIICYHTGSTNHYICTFFSTRFFVHTQMLISFVALFHLSMCLLCLIILACISGMPLPFKSRSRDEPKFDRACLHTSGHLPAWPPCPIVQ